MPVLRAARCRSAPADGKITSVLSVPCHAKDSVDGLCWQTITGLRISRIALAAMAFSTATAALKRRPPAGAQFCSLNPWLRRCSSRHAADSDRDRGVGARAAYRVVELA